MIKSTTDLYFASLLLEAATPEKKEGFLSRNRHKIAAGVIGAYAGKKLIDRFAPNQKEWLKDKIRQRVSPETHSTVRDVRRVSKAVGVGTPGTVLNRSGMGGGAAYAPAADTVVMSGKKDHTVLRSMGMSRGTALAHEMGHKKTHDDTTAFAHKLIKSQSRYLRRFGGKPGAMGKKDLDALRQQRVTLRSEAAASGAVAKNTRDATYPRNAKLKDAFNTYRGVYGHGDKMGRRLQRFDKAGGILGTRTRNSLLALSDRTDTIYGLCEAQREQRQQSPRPFAYKKALASAAVGGTAGALHGLHKLGKEGAPDMSNYAEMFPYLAKVKNKISPKFTQHATAAAFSHDTPTALYHAARAVTHTPGFRRGAAIGAGVYGGYKLAQHLKQRRQLTSDEKGK